MYLTTIASFAVGVFAVFSNANCLSQSDANTLATNFGKLVSAYSEKLANQTLTSNFKDYSESVATLMDSGGTSPKSLSGITFSSRAAFEAASGAQPSVPFTTQQLWYNCNVITVRWLSAQSPQAVYGISVLQTQYTNVWGNPSRFQINEVWGEFDSGAWLVNLGCDISGCPAPPSKMSKRELAFEA